MYEKTGAEIIVDMIQHHGVEYIFGYPGGAAMSRGRPIWLMGTPAPPVSRPWF